MISAIARPSSTPYIDQVLEAAVQLVGGCGHVRSRTARRGQERDDQTEDDEEYAHPAARVRLELAHSPPLVGGQGLCLTRQRHKMNPARTRAISRRFNRATLSLHSCAVNWSHSDSGPR